MHTVLIYHAHINTRKTKKNRKKKTQNIVELESYKKTNEKPTSPSSFISNICQKVDNKLKNIISHRIISRYVVHKTTDSNNRCLLAAENI